MPTGLTGRRNNIAYVGVEAPQPPNMLSYPRNPTTTDVYEYFIGDFWINDDRTSVDFQSLWYYASRLQNVATWLRLTTGAGALLFLTPDVGGAVFPLAGNINVNGLNGIVTTGNVAPASPHQITIGSSSGHTFVQSVEGDDLVKVFADNTGNINTRGGIILPNVLTNIETFGNVGTFTEFFALKNSILQPPTNAAGDQGVYALGSTGYVNDRFLHNYSSTGIVGQNTFVGYQSGNMTLTGTANTGCGAVVFTTLTTGTANGAFGAGALTALTTGSNNWAFGGLGMLTTGNQNSSLSGALPSLVTGSFNIAVGYHAGLNYTGAESSNITIGTGANSAGQTGENGIIRIVTTAAGDNNIFIGQNSGNLVYTIGTANQNTGVGAGTLSQLTTAAACTGVGQGALQGVTTGNHNTACGFGTLTNCTTSAENVAVGVNCLNDITTGTGRNTAIGTAAGDALTTGQNNLFLGFNAGINCTGAESSNLYALSFGILGESNTIRIGNPGGGAGQQNRCFIMGIRGITTGNADAVPVLVDSANQLGTVSSSIRYKTNIRHMEDESEDIYKLTPVIFNWKEDEDGYDVYGLIAEDVEGKMPYLVAHDENQEPYSVKYHELPVLLLNEIKKLKKEIDELKIEIDKVKNNSKL